MRTTVRMTRRSRPGVRARGTGQSPRPVKRPRVRFPSGGGEPSRCGTFMTKARTGLAGILVWLGAVQAGTADVVFTSDGSKLVGTIERMDADTLVITTRIAGKVEIDAAMITALAVDNPLTVQFESGDRLVGTIELSPDHDASVMHTALGELAISPEQITAIWPVGGESPEVAALKAETERTKAALTPKWSATLEAGASRSEGNTDTMEARGRFDLTRKTEDDLLGFYLAAKYAEQNKERTTNEYRGGVHYENLLTERWFWYTRLDLEFDEFEDLDLRSTAAAGAGRYWLKRPAHELKSRLGFGYRHESYDDGRTEDEAVADLGLDYRLKIVPWAQFTHSTTYSPNIEDTDAYRLDIDTALVFPLKDERLKLKLGMTNEYNSRPQRGLDRLDSTYYANLVLELTD